MAGYTGSTQDRQFLATVPMLILGDTMARAVGVQAGQLVLQIQDSICLNVGRNDTVARREKSKIK